jgi:hypothetical protein
MKKKNVTTPQKLSALLDSITTELSDSDKEQERSQRTAVLGALARYTKSRFHLGQALTLYRQACKMERIWLPASEAIAKYMEISPRTLFRIISDYERVSGLSETVLSAMESEGLDPAKRKNAPLVEQIIDVLGDDPTPEEAQEVVRHTAESQKQQRVTETTMSEDERIVRDLRQDIRKRLANVPDNGRKYCLLEEAICQESYEVWGERKEWTAVFTPCAVRTVDDQQDQMQAVAA